MSDEIAKKHQTGIGGSGASIVWGVSPFRTIHDLYADCLGLSKRSEPTLAQQIGNHCEPFIKTWYEQKTKRGGLTPQFMRSEKYPWMLGHVDWLPTVNQDRFAEFKVAGLHSAKEWGNPESCQVPLSYFLQGQHYSILTGIKQWDLVVMLGTEIKIYPCEHDDDIAEALIEKERVFWHENVLKKVPPPIDGTDACKQLLGQIYTKDRTPVDWAEGADAKLLDLFAEVKTNYEAEEGNYNELANKVRAAIGERQGLKTSKIKITWKCRKDGVRVFLPKLLDEMEGVA